MVPCVHRPSFCSLSPLFLSKLVTHGHTSQEFIRCLWSIESSECQSLALRILASSSIFLPSNQRLSKKVEKTSIYQSYCLLSAGPFCLFVNPFTSIYWLSIKTLKNPFGESQKLKGYIISSKRQGVSKRIPGSGWSGTWGIGMVQES